MAREPRARNGLKLELLEYIDHCGSATAAQAAQHLWHGHIQTACAYMLRLQKMHLLCRGFDVRGHWRYELTPIGKRRLVWLQGQFAQFRGKG